ncbi:hypothetical protein KIN20_029282 [Parelaphostrongylus tenuis]|uniref:Uncharacterized protein n=1 Tax=Parelaphostrongylus tenuis TaxID=148309 RepID=A0AAD5R2B8_PARTN|nr:hypothetical protein KIN20_029282 [Parelaphostrongylus tenuis]
MTYCPSQTSDSIQFSPPTVAAAEKEVRSQVAPLPASEPMLWSSHLATDRLRPVRHDDRWSTTVYIDFVCQGKVVTKRMLYFETRGGVFLRLMVYWQQMLPSRLGPCHTHRPSPSP